MVTVIVLIISIVLQFIAAFLALRQIRITKGRLSWILISIGFLFMAIKQTIEFIPYIHSKMYQEITTFSNWLSISTSILITIGVTLMGEIFLSIKKAEKLRLESEIKVLNAIILTEEKERKRFSADLHDGLGPLLSTIKLYINSLKSKKYDEEQKANIVRNADSVIDEAILSTREIANNLMSNVLSDFGFIPAIESFIKQVQNTDAINIDFKLKNFESRLDQGMEIILFRTVKELINNTLKHAHAKNIFIKLSYDRKFINLLYKDDGVGCDEKILNDQGSDGMGLRNIFSRLKSINGTYDFTGGSGKGFGLVIKVPFLIN